MAEASFEQAGLYLLQICVSHTFHREGVAPRF